MGNHSKLRAAAMDQRLRSMIIGPRGWRKARPTMPQQEGDEEMDVTSHTEDNTSEEGEVHPQLFCADASRRRLGLDSFTS